MAILTMVGDTGRDYVAPQELQSDIQNLGNKTGSLVEKTLKFRSAECRHEGIDKELLIVGNINSLKKLSESKAFKNFDIEGIWRMLHFKDSNLKCLTESTLLEKISEYDGTIQGRGISLYYVMIYYEWLYRKEEKRKRG